MLQQHLIHPPVNPTPAPTPPSENPKPGWWLCTALDDGGWRWEWKAHEDALDPDRNLDDGNLDDGK